MNVKNKIDADLSPNRKYFSRRLFLEGIVVSVSALHFSACRLAETNLPKISTDGQFFSAHELTLLTDIAELMIPRTDTPGATDADVAAVLDGMMLSWAGQGTRQQLQRALKLFETKAQGLHHKAYTSLFPEQRLELLVDIDTTAFSKHSNDAYWDYRKLKELVFLVYYSSEEAGETYVPLPGEYYGNLTFEAYEALMSERAYGG